MNMIESTDSYLEIIMGKDILPYIFQDLKENGGFWFSALEKFTGVNPIKPEHKGIINLMVEDWLKWQKKMGICDSFILYTLRLCAAMCGEMV